VAVLTVGRSDYSILRPVLSRICDSDDLALELIATGMHLSPKFGMSIKDIERDEFSIFHRFEMLEAGDEPSHITGSIARGIAALSEIFSGSRPDLLLLMGDRFEMLAGAIAAMPYCIPIAHIHGGETSEGAIDEGIRHAITKFSYLHFVSLDRYRRRVIQMGESPDRVIVSGAPALDNILTIEQLSRLELERQFGLDLSRPPLLVTFHSTTLDLCNLQQHTDALMRALAESGKPVIFTSPNADTGHDVIFGAIQRYLHQHHSARYVPSFGVVAYYSILKHVSAMVGNSSSGIIESGSFGLPVVNIGDRQRGREAGPNVIHSAPEETDITNALEKALMPAFKTSLARVSNIYGDGNASKKIVETLCCVDLSPGRLMKAFYDLPAQ
jgi:UDP-hydrolysing UDP-N-acetyl-D-glucosamine 2-epimerase